VSGPRWRFTLHERSFSPSAPAAGTAITELTECRSRRLETALNAPAKLTFSLDGRSQAALYIGELTTEVMAWRHDETTDTEALMFRGVVAQSQDSVSEQSHTVNVTAHDYWAILARRYLVSGVDLVYTGWSQDDIITNLTGYAINASTAGGVSLVPGSLLPLTYAKVNPDGTPRTVAGPARDRTYQGGTSIGDAIANLTGVIDGPDVDFAPRADVDGTDHLRIFWPRQGVDRPDCPFEYGFSVAAFSRSVNSIEYANYARVLGSNPDTTQGAPQFFAERANVDANDVTRVAVGLWMHAENESDVKVIQTLQEKADGLVRETDGSPGGEMGVLVPSYSLSLTPGWFRPGYPNLGDTVPLRLDVGRLAVSGTVRVLGLGYAIGDDGGEDVEVVTGRPAATLSSLFTAARRDINALARR
jgi:hypothetical protein